MEEKTTSTAPEPEVIETVIECDPEDVAQNKVMAILAYCGILILIPLFAGKDSKFTRFHVNQALVLLIASCLCCTTPITFVLMIMGIVNAAKGQAKRLPITGKFNILK